MSAWVVLWLLLLCGAAGAEDQLLYRLSFSGAPGGRVAVRLQLPQPTPAPLTFVMPRTYPGGYAQIGYDEYVLNLTPRAADGKALAVGKDPDAPRWLLGKSGDSVFAVEYLIDVARMEEELHDAVSTSKVRNGYVGLLGYSIFGYVEGFETRKLELRAEGPTGWPLLLTLKPELPLAVGQVAAVGSDFYALADSQVLMGPDLKVTRWDGSMPLLMALYAEGEVDAALEGRLAREALDRVQGYFGDKPIAQYTVQLELLRPAAGHAYGFSQEHLTSGTFSLSVEAALQTDSSQAQQERVRFNFAHHMAHSWIPKRAYGVGYKPFSWELTPVIDTIWFNEGFGRYAAIAALAAGLPAGEGAAFRRSQLQALRTVVDSAPPFIRRMPLEVLSREASFLYSADFRTGKNVFARGALMAAEMDDKIVAGTHGAKSLRDALRWLLRWSAVHNQPFQSEDLPGYFASATGVDVAAIYRHWQQPLESP